MRIKVFHFLIILSISCFSCASYYQINADFNKNFENGNLKQAREILLNNKKAADSKLKFLYYANMGVVNSILGNYQESNNFLEQAYLFGEDYRKNYLNIAASYFTNPSILTYPGEDHEHLFVLYYKALNYLKMASYDSALVECRRLNIRLNELSDKYRSDNKYQEDAFIHTLMGIIYEADKDINNAFIAYRNAYNIYEDEYLKMFGLGAPLQLKKDLLRTAYLMGFQEELNYYEQKFDLKYQPAENKGGQLVFFWNNGLGPVKSEWSINFAVVRGENGLFTFVNEDYNMSFPFFLNNEEDEEDRKKLSDLEFFRVAFPKYVERPPLYHNARLKVNGAQIPLEKSEDLNAIAFKTLRERMLVEFSKSLLRVALKKATEYAAREENDGLGTAISLINAITEKADTRNWQTIPHSIHYTRIFLPEGEHEVTLTLSSELREIKDQKYQFSYKIDPGEVHFHSFHSLETASGSHPSFYY